MNAVPSPGYKKTKNFKLNQGIANILNFTFLFIIQQFSRGRGPSQSSHSFACKQAKRDIFASQKVGFSPEPPHSLAGATSKNQNYKRSASFARERNGTAKTLNFGRLFAQTRRGRCPRRPVDTTVLTPQR